MADLNRQFLERIVVWPGGKEAPGWINLHCHMKNRDPSKNGGKDWVIGWPFKTVEDFISRAKWLETTDQFFDAWFCTSQQSQSSANKAGKPKAVRLHRNATWLKAIWVDIDVKDDDKHYHTAQDAWNVVSAFRRKVGLPLPSAIVNSGGGLHVYWISHVPLSPDEWRPYAEGLKALLLAEDIKCDTGLTTDDVRILRVPGTSNYKYSPPRPVELLHLGKDYNFGVDLALLKLVAPAPETSPAANIEPDFANSPDPAFASLSPDASLQGGIERSTKLLDPRPIFQDCGFLRQAFATGGKDFDNPLWNLSVLCTTFMENGHVYAHEISKGHAGYAPPDTQALYDRKMADRVDRDIGYPSCATIQGAGCKSCATCPLLAKGKSPLNIRPPLTAAVTTAQSASAKSLQLPVGYDVNNDGIICRIETKRTRDGDVEEKWLPLFHSRIDLPWVQKDPDIIHFRVSYDKGNTLQTSMRHEDWCGQDVGRKFASAKVKYVSDNKGHLEGFMNAWLSKMHDAAVAQTAQAFGWYHEAGVLRGFAYGGFIHMDDGSNPQAGMTDRHTQRRFQPAGQAAPWYNALSYITRQKRPELDTVVAASFAAPLMQLTGTTGAMLSAWGTSGVGKTYALEVGAAVWGHPKESKEVTSTTWKSVEKRLASTVNLPVMWDEITNVAAQKNVLEVLMLTTGGVRGGRLNQNTDQREKGTWSTLLSINSNLCFKEYIASQQATHTAGLNRVLEYQIAPAVDPVGMVARKSEAAQALMELSHNYGNVGLEYARMLGRDHVRIKQRIDKVLGDLEEKLQPTEEDRFWIGVIAALLVGAELANLLNVGFDRAALEAFLLRTFEENRVERVEASTTPSAMSYAEDHLTAFLQDHLMSTIWCESSPNGAGVCGRIAWRRLFPNAPLPSGVSVRFDDNRKCVVMSVRKFRDWCIAKQLSATAIEQSFIRNYGMTRDRASLAAGTGLGGGQERVLNIDVTNYPDLIAMMSSQSPSTDLGAVVGMGGAAMDTGIVASEETQRDGVQA